MLKKYGTKKRATETVVTYCSIDDSSRRWQSTSKLRLDNRVICLNYLEKAKIC